jgi:hypothetical protein
VLSLLLSVCFLSCPTLFANVNGFVLFPLSERRAQKAAEVAELRAKGGQPHPDDGNLSDEDASAEDELESEDPYDAQDLSTDEKRKTRIPDLRSPHTTKKQRLDNGSSRIASAWPRAENTSIGKKSSQSMRPIRPKGRADFDIHTPSVDASGSSRLNRRLMLGFADLATISGRYVFPSRLEFIFSIDDADIRRQNGFHFFVNCIPIYDHL